MGEIWCLHGEIWGFFSVVRFCLRIAQGNSHCVVDMFGRCNFSLAI